MTSPLASALILACLAALTTLLGGCASSGENADIPEYNLIVTQRAEVYYSRPNELSTPDDRWGEGMRVRILSIHGSHYKVERVDGKQAWISTRAVGAQPSGFSGDAG